MAAPMDTSKKKKKEAKNRKVPLQCFGLCSSSTDITKTTPEIQVLRKRRFQEVNSAQAPSSPDRGF
jgi:hypothetical protein